MNRSYIVPDGQYITATETVVATQVRKGDQVNGRVVGQVKTGTKWTTARTEDGKLVFEKLMTDEVEVQRQVESPESQEARLRAKRNITIVDLIAGKDEAVALAATRFNERVLAGALDGFVLAELLQAQAEHKLVNELARMAELSFFADKDHVDVRDALVARLTEKLVEASSHRALSRSTSVTHNLLDDCDLEAAANFVRNRLWF